MLPLPGLRFIVLYNNDQAAFVSSSGCNTRLNTASVRSVPFAYLVRQVAECDQKKREERKKTNEGTMNNDMPCILMFVYVPPYPQ